ncbi:MAG: bifunctional oligoribonuclease/PAP phosphatase NrnA [Deltaproteobacteria bacterium]|nr:bifunctional oligoribonuclease/PAP phosphatase NrnA [Deltaproteobacteria bacterium]
MSTNKGLTEIADRLQEAERILIVAHAYPDSDAFGSQLALGNILSSMGKEVVLYGEEPASHILDFLPGCEKLSTELPAIDAFDCIVALDCGDAGRLGKNKEHLLQIQPVLVIDHHSGHKVFGDVSWVEDFRSSTGEMVYELSLILEADLAYDTAYCLYAAIVSDTGSFKYSSTSARCLEIASNLVALGVKPVEIAGKIFENFSKNRLSLLQNVLSTLQLYELDQVAVITVTCEQYKETGTIPEDTELFINYPRALNTVKVAVFIKETMEERVSVSMRSKGKYDIAEVARKFGGGGHRNAAGFKVSDMTLSEVLHALLPDLRKLVN